MSASKNFTRFGNCSTVCSTGASRAWTSSYAMPSCRSKPTCGSTSINGAGRAAAGAGVHLEVHRTCRLEGGILRNAAVYFNSRPSPGPGHLRALCAVVQLLGQGHSDGHPLMPQHGAEPSLSLAAGTACAAALRIVCIHHHNDGFSLGFSSKDYKGKCNTCEPERLVVVVGCCCFRRDLVGAMSMSTESDDLCKGALDGEELFAIEGSKNWRSTPNNLKERENGLKRPKTTSSPP